MNLPPLKSLLIKDVELGTGKIENVLLAQTTGSSTTKENVFPYLINAKHSTDQELVFLAMMDTT